MPTLSLTPRADLTPTRALRPKPRPSTPRILGAMALSALTLTALSSCAPRAELLQDPIVEQIKEGIRSGQDTFTHDDLTLLLSAHVREDQGRVDYQGLKRDRDKLASYTARIAQASLSALPEPELKALLINAYNAYTLQLIIERYPDLRSIRDLRDPWATKRYVVGGQTLSLDDIEHGLLRPLFKDPRIHFAVNCASIGCPVLAATAFEGARLEEQLEAAARRTLQDPRYATTQGDTLQLTAILDWYGGDFTNPSFKGHAKTVAAYVAPYASPQVRELIQRHDGAPKVSFLTYDWSLNDVTPN